MKYKSIFRKKKDGPLIEYDRPVTLKYQISEDFAVYEWMPNHYDYLYKDICFAQMAGVGTKQETEALINDWLLGIGTMGSYHFDKIGKAIEMCTEA